MSWLAKFLASIKSEMDFSQNYLGLTTPKDESLRMISLFVF